MYVEAALKSFVGQQRRLQLQIFPQSSHQMI